jgi:hypothetical protein
MILKERFTRGSATGACVKDFEYWFYRPGNHLLVCKKLSIILDKNDDPFNDKREFIYLIKAQI